MAQIPGFFWTSRVAQMNIYPHDAIFNLYSQLYFPVRSCYRGPESILGCQDDMEDHLQQNG